MEENRDPDGLSEWLEPRPGRPSPPRQALRRMASYALMAVGGLWTLLCGACTINFAVQAVLHPVDPPTLWIFALLVLLPGMIFTVLGLLVIRWGRRVLRGG